MAMVFGDVGAPSQITVYLDSLFSQSLSLYRKKLTDNIGAMNAILYEILHSDAYESGDGGTDIREPIMYQLAPADSYDGYDELSTLPVDGITQAVFEWRQKASPIVYAMSDVLKNSGQGRLINFVKSKIQQTELGLQESWAQDFMHGNQPNGGLLSDPRQSGVNGSLSINPISQIISYNTTTLSVGNIAENLYPWWKNQSFTSTATTYSNYIYEITNMYNTCSLGTGGPPTVLLADQVSYQNYIHAYFSQYKANPDALDFSYPFEGKKFMKAKIIMDDKVPDVFSGKAPVTIGGIGQPSSLTWGSIYAANTKFMKIRYMTGRDFEMLTDEQGKTFAKPINGDSRIGHLAWMGQVTTNNRRKHGVLGKIPRQFAS